MPPVVDEAVCIRQWDWSETSQTVSLFCRGLGLVRGLAKGSKRPKGAYSGGIELLSRGRTGVIARSGSELALVTEWELLETFPALRRNLESHYAGLYMAELVQHSVHDHDPHVALYDALLEGLRALIDQNGRALSLLRFQWALLVETGYKPSFDGLDQAGHGPVTGRTWVFDPARGGLVAGIENHGGPVSPTPGEAGWRVRPETVGILKDLDRGGAGPWNSEGVERASRLLAAYLRHVLGREPRTLPLVFGAGLPR